MRQTRKPSLPQLRQRAGKAIEEGRLGPASREVRAIALARPGDAAARADRTLVDWLLDAAALPGDRPAAWKAAVRVGAARCRDASPSVAVAVRRFLARGLARAAELEEGRGALVAAEPVGAYLLEAELPEEAAESLFATLARLPASSRAALLLGNALFRLGRLPEARDHYRRALRVAPLEVALDELEDAEVRGLAELAAELELPGDVRPWLPALGFLEDVLPLSALDPVPGAGFGPGSRAYDLLIAHKGARSQGERLAIRRDLELLSPKLYEALLAARRLDPRPATAGTA